MRFLRLCLAATVLWVMSGPAFGTGTMRCATHVVDQGTSKDEVVAHCGEPDLRKDGDQYWFYDRGSSLNVTRVFFVDDKVEFIDDVARDEM